MRFEFEFACLDFSYVLLSREHVKLASLPSSLFPRKEAGSYQYSTNEFEQSVTTPARLLEEGSMTLSQRCIVVAEEQLVYSHNLTDRRPDLV